MQLSKRLLMVTSLVKKGSVVADVGCDHAYISIYLVSHGIAMNTIALDINKGPLIKARENINTYGLSNKISVRLSDGLKKLEPGEASSIVIAGMGGALGVNILSEGSACVDKAQELILQLQSELDKVRVYLHTIGFIIDKEVMCKEDGKFYTAIHAIRGEVTEECYKPVYLKYGKYLLMKKDEVLKEYLSREYHKAIQIKTNLEQSRSEKARERLVSLGDEISELSEALSYYED